MKWGKQDSEKLALAKAGILLYAIIPTRMTDGTWVWFENYWSALHEGPMQRTWWVSSLDRANCVQPDLSKNLPVRRKHYIL